MTEPAGSTGSTGSRPASAPPDRLGLLYVCYLTLEDPLAHTQVVAYLGGLAAAGHRVHLLTFEPGLTRARRRHWRGRMRAMNVNWHGLRYHRRPSLPATLYDTLLGALHIAVWTRWYHLDVVHARTHVPAAMGLIAAQLSRRPPALIFDVRGLMVEEYEEAGRWRPGGVPSRLTRRVERAAIRRADQIVVLTEKVRTQRLVAVEPARVHVIPCCANLQRIQSAAGAREDMRRALGLEDCTVMVYVGKFPSSSMPDAMADFYLQASDSSHRLHFLILTQEDGGVVRRELARIGAPPSVYTITSAPPAEVGRYLAAGDFAVTFTKRVPSAVAQSQTKVGEYLAAGLPVVYSAGIGDIDELMSPDIGVRVDEHSPSAHRRAGRAIRDLLNDAACPDRCRDAAERHFSLEKVGIPRYLSVYAAIAGVRPRPR